MSDNVTRIGWTERFKLRASAVIWFLLGAGFLLSLPLLLDISYWAIIGLAGIALVLCLPAAWLIRRLFRGQRSGSWAGSLFKAFLGILFITSILTAAPLYYFALLTDLRPMTVPQATLSNGTKTVVFQGMSHVGTEGFYKSVVYDLEEALDDGYVLYYEGVMPSPEGDDWFSKTVASGGDLATTYKLLGDVCGLKFQLDYFRLLATDMAAHPDRHVKADVTTADMMHEYDRLMRDDPEFAATQTPPPGADKAPAADDGLAGFLDWLQNGTPEQRRVAGIACRGLMTMQLSRRAQPEPLDKVIVDFRNRALADRIAAESRDKIYVTYGADHLTGLLALLQEKDPAWQIESLKWMRTIAAPEELDGKL